MGITAFYGKAMEDVAAVALLEGVRKAGYTHFDTAEIYMSTKSVIPCCLSVAPRTNPSTVPRVSAVRSRRPRPRPSGMRRR